MATNDQTNEEQALQQNYLRQRRALGNALGSLLGAQNNKTFQAFTFEEALDLQIERISGAGTVLRPNELTRVDRIETEVLKAVEELKQVPPEQFLDADPDEDVNTALDPE